MPHALTADPTSYQRTHRAAGFFDATGSFGRLITKGKDALDLLHRMSTGDLRPVMGTALAGTQTVLTNEKGRIIDLLTVIQREEDAIIVCSEGREQTIVSWLDKYTIMEDAKFIPASASVSQYGVFGPRALDVLQRHTDVKLMELAPFMAFRATVAGFPILVQKAQRIAESGYWVFADEWCAADVRQFLEAEVLEFGGAVIDSATYNVLRIESGMPLAPNELNDRHNPLETTLVSAVSFTKGCYIGQEVIARLDSYDKVQRHMMGVVIDGVAADVAAEFESALGARDAVSEGATHDPLLTKDVLAHPATSTILRIEDAQGEQVGALTSYAVSPGMQKMIGLGFVKSAYSNAGQLLSVRLHERGVLPARLVKLPFDVE